MSVAHNINIKSDTNVWYKSQKGSIEESHCICAHPMANEWNMLAQLTMLSGMLWKG